MKKTVTVLLICLFAFNIYGNSQFWDHIGQNKLSSGLELSVELAESDPIYWLYSANIANLLGDYTLYEMYIFNFDIHFNDYNVLLNSTSEIADNYNNSYIYSFIGMILWDEGFTDDAIVYLEKSIELDESNSYALNYLSMNYYESDKQKFLDLSLKAIECNPQYSQPYNNAAIAYLELGDEAKSSELLLDSLLNLETPHPNSYYNLVYLLNTTIDGISYNHNNSNYLLSLTPDGLTEIHRLFSNYNELYFSLLDQMLVLGDHNSTLTLLEMANNDKIFLEQDYFYSQLGYLFNNIEECRLRAISYAELPSPKYKNLYLLGVSLFNLGEVDTALIMFERSLELADSKDLLLIMRLHANIGSCHLQNENYELAVSEMIIALEYNPYDTITLINIGRYYYQEGNLSYGLHYLERARNTTDDQRYIDFIDSIISE